MQMNYCFAMSFKLWMEKRKTTGPKGLSGDIVKKLDGCENLSVVDFVPVPSYLPDSNQSNLSRSRIFTG